MKVGGKVIGSVENKNARTYDNVKVYVSDPWHQTTIGFMRNLKITGCEFKFCSVPYIDAFFISTLDVSLRFDL